MSWSFDYYIELFIFIIKGVPVTLSYSFISVFFGLIIGAILAFLKISDSKFGKIFADFYTSIFRGTPLLIQLFMITYGLPPLLGIKLSIAQAGVIAFSINSGAYLSEVIRAGIQTVEPGQFEAARSLNIPYYQTMRDIILPQALRNVLPSLVNELINMLKESAIISVLGEMDIMRRAQVIGAANYDYLNPLLIAAFNYYIIVLILTYCAKLIERKINI